MLLWLLLSCGTSVPSEAIDIGPLLDTTYSFIAEAPFDFYSEAYCFQATTAGSFYIYEPPTTWIYDWVEQDTNVYHVLEGDKLFMEVQVLAYDSGVYKLKLRQGLLGATVYTTECE